MNQTDIAPAPVAMNKTQLAAAYNICPATLKKWLEPFGIVLLPGTNIYTPAQVKAIYEKLGTP